MVEIDLNRMLVASIKASNGWAYKIADPSFTAIKRGIAKNPYDIFGMAYNGKGIHLEAKLIKPDTNALLCSFPFSKIEDHQIENLTELCRIREQSGVDSILSYPIGYWRSRTLFVVFFFDADYIHKRIASGEKSIKGPEMMKFYEEGKYLEIKKKFLNAKAIEKVMIR